MIRKILDICRRFFTRDNFVWSLSFFSSILIFVASHTSLVPDGKKEVIQDIAAVMGMVSGKLGWSSLPSKQSVERKIENRKEGEENE